MSRSTDEWRGASDSTPVPPRVRIRQFERDGGVCQCGCKIIIRPGMKWQTDHKVALINGGKNRESNLTTLLTDHHKVKTARDLSVKSKTAAMRAKHLGLKKQSRFPFSRDSRLKKKVNGEVVER